MIPHLHRRQLKPTRPLAGFNSTDTTPKGRRSVSLQGTLDLVDNTADTGTSTFLARAQFPNPGGTVLPGTYASVSVTVGSGTSGAGGSVSVLAGRSTASTGGLVSIETGEGTASTSGKLVLRSANAGSTGASGMLVLSSGTSSGGATGDARLGRATGQQAVSLLVLPLERLGPKVFHLSLVFLTRSYCLLLVPCGFL